MFYPGCASGPPAFHNKCSSIFFPFRKILVNLDKSYDIFYKCYPIIKKTGTIKQVVIKGNKTRQELENDLGKYIDEIYSKAINAGALGGKILGAGGGGFILFYANQSQHKKIRSVLKSLVEVPFMFENSGSIVLNNPSGF